MTCTWCERDALWVTQRGVAECGHHAAESVLAGVAVYPVAAVIRSSSPPDRMTSAHQRSTTTAHRQVSA